MTINISKVSLQFCLFIIFVLLFIIVSFVLVLLLDFFTENNLFLIVILSDCYYVMGLRFNFLFMVFLRLLAFFLLHFVVIML
jgi:hypothetical protein